MLEPGDVYYLHFVLPGRPRTWMRTGGHGRIRFENPKQKTSKHTLQVYALQAMRAHGHDWPMSWYYKLRLDAYWSLAQSKCRKTRPVPMAPRGSKPDADNLVKLVADGLEGMLWTDDSRLVDVAVRKWTAAQGEPSRTVVQVWAIHPEGPWQDVIRRDV